MVTWFLQGRRSARWSWLVSAVVTCASLTAALALSGGRSKAYTAYSLAVHRAEAIPAFARKYGLRCSACHTVWPELNAFGQRFKDNGYQLGNDRDSPIFQSNAYFPLALRTTPQGHLESTTHQPVDAAPGEKPITQTGFDLSGVDFLMLGTLHKDITFGLVPTLDADGTAGLEAAFVRFDNLGHSPWANVRVGKFELDNLLSEKRFTWLSNNGGFLYAYHYQPAGSVDNYAFGLGDNQIGAELSGHSDNSYTRYSVSVLTTDDGEAGLPGGKSVDAMFTLSRAFALGGGLGPQRVGVFGYLGHRPTAFETVGGDPIPGTGSDNKSFYRLGATAQLEPGAARGPLRRDRPPAGAGALRAAADVEAGRSRDAEDARRCRRVHGRRPLLSVHVQPRRDGPAR